MTNTYASLPCLNQLSMVPDFGFLLSVPFIFDLKCVHAILLYVSVSARLRLNNGKIVQDQTMKMRSLHLDLLLLLQINHLY
jgi:hypothetical protein